jgi:DNA-binding GntR family transcriptional regulator
MFDQRSPFLQPPQLAPTAKRSFAEKRLREAILWCELEPGSVVSEASLVDRFGLGRAAVRAGLARLAATGLVSSAAREGWTIRPITGALIGEVVGARRLVEPKLVDAQLSSADHAQLARLGELLAALQGRQEPASVLAARQYDDQVMVLLAARSNPFLTGWLIDIWEHSHRITRFLERGVDARLSLPDRAGLIASLASGQRKRAIAEIERPIRAFASFAAAALLTHPSQIAGAAGLEYARPEGEGPTPQVSKRRPRAIRRSEAAPIRHGAKES